MKRIAAALSAALLLSPLFALAQSLPRPKEFYFDEDTAVARPIVVIEGSDEAAITQLVRRMERGGRDAPRASAQLAHLSMASGRQETGRALYARVLSELQTNSSQRHAVAWNYGWDLYRAGDVEEALAHWSEAFAGRMVNPAWVPPTLALALWRLDRRGDAVVWYAAAVRTEPQLWQDATLLPRLLPDWTDADRAVLAEVLEAWRADPPAWP